MTLDRRLNAFRRPCRQARCEGQVEADRFAEAGRAVIVPVADRARAPSHPTAGSTPSSCWAIAFASSMSPRAGHGCRANATVMSAMPAERAVIRSRTETDAPRHALSTFCIPEPELKLPPLQALSMGSLVAVAGEEERRGTRYAMLADGTAIFRRPPRAGLARREGLRPSPNVFSKSLICGAARPASASIAPACPACRCAMTGYAPCCATPTCRRRRSANRSKSRAPISRRLRRGDLVFWKGHVGIMVDGKPAARQRQHHDGRSNRSPRRSPASKPHFGKPTSLRRP
jgi:hypothetical protein